MIDLHCHTNYSDGSMSILELLKLAKKKGIKHLAITDHDTTKGLAEAEESGKQFNINIIPGIEISAFDYKRKKKVHILGLYIDYKDGLIENFCKPLQDKRNELAIQSIYRLIDFGFNITLPEVLKIAKNSSSIFKQHIMQALMNTGYCDSICCKLLYDLFSEPERSKNTGILYKPINYLDAYDAVKIIKQANGLPVLAHPPTFDSYDLIPDLIKAGLAGIELKHTIHKKTDEDKINSYVEKYSLIPTYGSDFHGHYGYGNENMGYHGDQIIKMLESKRSALYS